MKKHISIFLCAALAFAACTPQSAETADDVYQGIRASVEMSSDEAIPADGGQLVVTLHRSPEFTVSVPKTATWLSYSQADSVITFKAGANPSAVLRYARVGIIDKDLQIAITNFDVMQAGTAKDVAPVTYKQFSVSPEEITVEAKATSATFTVTADDEVAWTVTSDNSAFTADPASGNGKKTVTVSFPANTAKEVVKANLTVSTASTEVHTNSYVIAISQEAAKDEQDAVKPAAGTVLAEWEFETGWIDDLRKGGNQAPERWEEMPVALQTLGQCVRQNLTAEQYTQAMQAGQIPADQSAQINAAVENQMAEEAVQEQIEATLQAQIEQLVQQNTEEYLAADESVAAQLAMAQAAYESLSQLKAQLDQVNTFVTGLQAYTAGAEQAAAGAMALHTGLTQINAGAANLSEGAAALSAGAFALNDGTAQASDGAAALQSGTAQLSAGTSSLHDMDIHFEPPHQPFDAGE